MNGSGRLAGAVLQRAGAIDDRIDAGEMREPILRAGRAREFHPDDLCREQSRRRAAAGRHDDLVSLRTQVGGYGRADEAARADDENAHDLQPFASFWSSSRAGEDARQPACATKRRGSSKVSYRRSGPLRPGLMTESGDLDACANPASASSRPRAPASHRLIKVAGEPPPRIRARHNVRVAKGTSNTAPSCPASNRSSESTHE